MKKSVWERIRGTLGTFRDASVRFIRIHPWQALALGVLLLILAVQGLMIFGQYMENKSERTRIMALQQVPLSEVDKAMSAGEITKVVRHTLSVGSWKRPETRSFLEVLLKDGTAWRIEESTAASAKIWDGLVERAFAHPLELATGYQADRDDRLARMIGMLGLMMFIVMALLFAQMMVGEVLSGKSFRPLRPDTQTRFPDVIGVEKVKASLEEVVDQLRHAEEYSHLSMKAPRGILFTGDPGVGKTMLARALANELGAEFFVATGADFAEMYVGVGPKRIRALFRQARMTKLALIFIDEIDAIGSREGMGNDSERRSTINALLAEMDGMEQNGRLLVVGATNHVEHLDPALRRPGRFDRIIHIPLPSLEDRERILTKYLDGVSLAPDVDLRSLALRTQGYSGAQLSGMAAQAKNQALREAGGRGQGFAVHQRHLVLAQEIALLGEEGRNAQGQELERVTYHELGHALTGHVCCENGFVEKVTVRGRGGSLGATMSQPLEEQLLVSQAQCEGQLVMLLGGRAAEEVLLESPSSGAGDDLRRATGLARRMVLEFGMGTRTGLVAQVSREEALRPEQVQDMQDILSSAYERAKQLVRLHRPWFEAKAPQLIEQGMLGHDALFQDLPGHPPKPRPGEAAATD